MRSVFSYTRMGCSECNYHWINRWRCQGKCAVYGVVKYYCQIYKIENLIASSKCMVLHVYFAIFFSQVFSFTLAHGFMCLQMWSIEYVQVPFDETAASKSGSRPDTPKRTEAVKPLPIHNRLVKQINISNDSISGILVKSGSESSLSEESNLKAGTERQAPCEISSKEWRSKLQNEKETCSDNEETVVIATPIPPARRRSRVHAAIRKSEGEFGNMFNPVMLSPCIQKMSIWSWPPVYCQTQRVSSLSWRSPLPRISGRRIIVDKLEKVSVSQLE